MEAGSRSPVFFGMGIEGVEWGIWNGDRGSGFVTNTTDSHFSYKIFIVF